MKITISDVRYTSSIRNCYALNIAVDGDPNSVMVMPVDAEYVTDAFRPALDLPASVQETLLDLSVRQQVAVVGAIESAAILLCRQHSQHKVRASITLDLEF